MDNAFLKKLRQKPISLGHYMGYKDLYELHNKWILDCFVNNKDLYVLQAHRNSYKTTTIIVVGVIWYLLFNPNKTILIMRKDFSSSSQTMFEIVKHYNSEKIKYLYKRLFNFNLELARQTSFTVELNTKLNISKEGNIECAGIYSSLTGRHYDLIICDDIVNMSDRYSKIIREDTKIKFDELKNVKKQGGKIILTGTQWHKEDLFSHLENQGINIDRYPISKTNILSQEHIESIKKTMNDSLFACNYELRHINNTDKYFNDFKYMQFSRYEKSNNYMFVDTAFDGNDFTAISIIAKKNEKLIVRGFVYRKNTYDMLDDLIKLYEKYNIKKMYIETNADKGIILKELRKKYPQCNIEGYYENRNKHIKITTTIKKYQENLFFCEDCQVEYMGQIIDYSDFSQHDDAPDSLASLLLKINKQETVIINGVI